MTENRDNYIRTYRKTEMGNTLMAGKDMTISAGGNLSARSSIMASERGKVTLAAGDDVTLSNGYNEAREALINQCLLLFLNFYVMQGMG